MPPLADKRASSIDLVVFDVDGVLTRGDITYTTDGQELKTFNVQDGHGFALARMAGLKTAILTARTSPVVRRRAEELKVDAFVEGQPNKAQGMKEIIRQLGVRAADVCFVGDDLVDLPALKMVGLPVAVANAVEEVKESALCETTRGGGEGAAREVIEMILKARGLWPNAVKHYRELTHD